MDWNQYAKDIRQASRNVDNVVRNGRIALDSLGFTSTMHQQIDRTGRDASIRNDAGGIGSEVLAVYFVDKGHRNGPELHWITDNGIIIITNALRGNGLDICTKLTARPGQLKRYPGGGNSDWHACEQIFPDNDWRVPNWLLNKAQNHQDRGLNYMEESKNKKKKNNWMGVPGARYIYHGDWSDPEIVYDGFSLNYWDIEKGLLNSYRDENPDDKDDRGFDDWLEKQDPDWIKGILDDSVCAYYGDQIDKADDWFGIKGAYLLKDIETGADFVMYDGKRIEMDDIAEACGFEDAYDYEFEKFIEKAATNRLLKKQVMSALDKCKRSVELYCEDIQEDVLEMPDRITELENEIEKLWVRLGDLGKDKNETVLELIRNYVELEQLEPGRVDF